MKRERFLIFALILGCGVFLFWNLGERPLWGVEGRWAEGVREMILRGDWWVPTLNGVPHITKPLIPYWLIRLAALVFGGLNEFTVRLPVALCAAGTLGAFYFLARTFFEPFWALTATGLMATTWGFVAYARVAQSEIYQLFGITAALAFYFRFRERESLWGYLGFWLSAVFAALSKGLPGLVVPLMIAALELFWRRNFRHLNPKNLTVGLLALGLYFGHYYALSRATHSELPFYLFFRENVLQAVSPYDNREPFYVYFYYVPLLLLPWTPFFLVGGLWAVRGWRRISEAEKLVLLAIGAIFILFTLARARRSYYILPIVPLCLLVTTAYLRRALREPDPLSRALFYLYGLLTFLLGLGAVLLPFLWPHAGLPFPLKLAVGFSGLALLLALALCMAWDLAPWGLIWSYLIAAICGLALLTPQLTPPSEKVFGRALRKIARAEKTSPCALGKVSANLLFYLSWPEPVPSFRKPEELSPSCRLVFFREKFYKKEGRIKEIVKERGLRLYGLPARWRSRDENKNYLLASPSEVPSEDLRPCP
ncbi:phospholipid carrier-dependent glycosyltransferase [Thermosulfurimonas marina]|uniref:Phospholipid carrier-dependent glycosyltransferase n=1 Tax=Thermosulfurimonas marina TaxID=2047767 RepID=A0A6H1WSZ6_9BACT|nr:glycosyltransferase family 39 protein [Thermosulfurimonas marina]QJA06274.1 phospholipid carrier-dependent glycosyltransferase [Thermosulfurimonas marina]